VVGRDPTTAARTLAPGVAPAQFGAGVGGRVDLDGDGFADVVVGAPGFEVNGLIGAGAAFVYRGAAGGVVGDEFGNGATQLFRGAESLEAFGTSVAGIGDYNGDGFGDLAVGIPDTTVSFPAFFSAVGEVRIYDGSRLASVTPGKTVNAHALSASLDRTVQPGGAIGAPAGFRVRANASGFLGRARVKLEVETCPVSAPFGALACVLDLALVERGRPAATSLTSPERRRTPLRARTAGARARCTRRSA
jgi:hypothetical protein